MRKGRQLAFVTISVEQREELENWSWRPNTAQALAIRSRIVLLAADGCYNRSIAKQVSTTAQTVGKWRRRFLASGCDGLLDEPRPGTSRKLSDKQELVLAHAGEPARSRHALVHARQWPRPADPSQSSVSRLWRAFSFAPHRAETFKRSKDLLFIEKVRDVVGLYLDPPDRALVLCVDEKSPIQALDRTAPLLPMRPAQIERRTYDYARHGSTSLFATLNSRSETWTGQTQRRHRSVEFGAFLDTIEQNVPPELDVHLILDTPPSSLG